MPPSADVSAEDARWEDAPAQDNAAEQDAAPLAEGGENKTGPCRRSAELKHYRPLVKQIAGRIRARLPAHVAMDELEQAGLIGLNEALSRYEEGRGSTFETYAARRIEGSMLDALRANDTLSRDARHRLREVRTVVQRLEHELGRTPRAKEVANALGWPLEKFHRCMLESGASGMRAGDVELEGVEDAVQDGDDELHSVVDEHADPLKTVQQRQRHAALSAAFDALEAAERYVMESIYQKGLPLRDIGKVLGVSESRVSQMSAEIVAKLRRRLKDW
ncbi:MAG TPA: RNA polymerase sigma factor FliA [Burkholderiaceae bacterium]|nr:RNA polymerase sigma factor FliA [Burkholderiaceae bacterium]